MNIIRIHDFSDSRIDIYTRITENQLANIYQPEIGLFIAESPNVIKRALEDGYVAESFLTEQKQYDLREVEQLIPDENIPIYIADEGVLEGLVGFQTARGVWCAMRRKQLPTVEELCKDARRIVILEEVTNPTNVGAIVRSAAALNADAILLTGGCSDPLYRRAARVSMGCIFQVPWTYIKKRPNENYIDSIKALGFTTVAMALKEDSVSIDDERLHAAEHLAIVLGAEGDGLREETIEACDYTVMIPMTHGVDSLNVAAASAVAFWELCR